MKTNKRTLKQRNRDKWLVLNQEILSFAFLAAVLVFVAIIVFILVQEM
ncbi:hypothetical protein LCGC14_1420360 [marine sediment metagenome]|uniref:Uncharacterized protein n=1 Tax=marine sediment metagenome TaxID=412755 RepID=A0A0F9M738_9ZZZZ